MCHLFTFQLSFGHISADSNAERHHVKEMDREMNGYGEDACLHIYI